MFRAVADGFSYLFDLIWRAFKWLLDGLYVLLSPIFDLIAAIGYFIYMIGVILYKVVIIVLAVGKLLIGLIVGLFKTIFGLAPSSSVAVMPQAYHDVFNQLKPIFVTLQIDKVAYLLSFALWIFTAFIAVKIIGTMRNQ